MRLLADIDKQTREMPSAPAVVTDDGRVSFRDLARAVAGTMEILRQQGLGQNARIAIACADPFRQLVLSLAALRLGITQMPLQPMARADVKTFLCRQAGIDYLVGDRDQGTGLPSLVIPACDRFLMQESPAAAAPRADATALVLMGSGTTGTPKRIPIRFQQLDALVRRDLSARPHKPGERHFSFTPVIFYTALRRLLGALSSGASVVFTTPSEDPLARLAMLEVDHLSMGVSHARGLLQSVNRGAAPGLPRLKTLFIGGAPVDEPLRQALRQFVSPNLFIAYGSNEFGEACVASPAMQAHHPGCVGRPCPGVSLEVVDERGRPCAAGVTGKVRMRADGMFAGYEDAEDETRRFLRHGWHYPGDRGYLTDDGVLVFMGRDDDLITVDGINVYPREIEAVAETLPGLIDAAAFAVERPGGTRSVLAFTARRRLTQRELDDHLRARLGWRTPAILWQLEQMPRNEAGKILKRTLREELARRLGGDRPLQ